MSRLGHLGRGFAREQLRKKFAGAASSAALSAKAVAEAARIPTARKAAAAEAARRSAFHAEIDLAALFSKATPHAAQERAKPEEALRDLYLVQKNDPSVRISMLEAYRRAQAAKQERVLANDLSDLDREERGWEEWERHKPEPSAKIAPLDFVPPKLAKEEREPERVAEFLPPELRPFLERMPAPRRREREEWILKKVGWEGLEILGLSPAALAAHAEDVAREYAKRWPSKNENGEPINQEAEHRRGRDEKVQRKRARRAQSDALLYVEAAITAVGGRKAPKRPLYVSDYNLLLHRQHRQRTEQILGDLWLIREDDPSVRIPMLEVDRRARAAKAAERRTLIDMTLYRWRMLGWHVCWITITLPGEFVAHSTNEENRVSEWNPDLGPLEAMAAIQEDFHRVMCLLRERRIRPSGFWNSQPQQSGTPHRHILIAVPALEDARAVCDAFRAEFGTRKGEEDGPDRGCNASVIGDDDPRYRTRKGKSGAEETPASVAKYSARYSTRQETGTGDGGAESAAAESNEQARFEAWKRSRRARGHTWLGLDSQRSPIELWRTLWANAQRSDYVPHDARMALAMTHMRLVKKFTEAAMEAREAAKAFPKDDDDHLAEMDIAREASEQAAREAWHASIALGMWPDADLDPVELEWLRGETASGAVADPLPPMPLREPRETVYGETHNAFVGAVGIIRRSTLSSRLAGRAELFAAASALGFIDALREKIREKREATWKKVGLTATRRLFFMAAREAGFGLSRRPDETVAVFDYSGEILLKTEHSWLIVDTETAKAMVKESEAPDWTEKRRTVEESRCTPKATAEGKEEREDSWKAEERRNQLSVSPSYPRLGAGAPHHEDERPPG